MVVEKILEWAGTSKRDLLGFPDEVRRAFGYALGIAQLGYKHPTAKPWKGDGAGVMELMEYSDGNAYRAVYTVRFTKAVYVLHCFQKKSPSGIRTARTDIDLVHQRLKTAQQHYEEHYGQTN